MGAITEEVVAFSPFRHSMNSLGFVGAGAMGQALLRGLLAAETFAPTDLSVFDADCALTQKAAEQFGVVPAPSLKALAGQAKVLLLAVKPHFIPGVLEELREVLSSEHTLISVAAGIKTEQIESYFSWPIPVVRVMPNTPALVGEAASAICLGAHADESHREKARHIFAAVGLTVDVEEKLMDAVTGLSGSGPAYVYLFIEALSDAGVKMGLTREVSTRLAAQTVLGGAKMVLDTGLHPGELKDNVTSPGGTTIAALHALESRAFRAAVYDAVEASANRSRELSGS